MKTRKEIEALQKDWEKDPCWEIEETEGFEEHKEELKKYSDLTKIEWDERAEKKEKEQITRFNNLRLHESMDIYKFNLDVRIVKVSSGWIYSFIDDDKIRDRLFVPEIREK